MRTYKGILTELPPNSVFVFGSNTQGRHGAGAALAARRFFGAKYGQASGLQGQSYAIITKDLTKNIHPSISRDAIILQIMALYNWAKNDANTSFYIAYSGDGVNLNGYTPQDMAEMFNSSPIPDNIVFEEGMAKMIQSLQYIASH